MPKKDWKKAVIKVGSLIREAAIALENGALQIALVVGDDGRLAGVVTDGDLRRGLLAGKTFESPVEEIMVRNFFCIQEGKPDLEVIKRMKELELRQAPVLDRDGRLIDLKVIAELAEPAKLDNWVVLMAGGLGTRLRPLTDNCPKPLLKVGGRPILEIILRQFIAHGFHKFFISVNYKAEMVEQFFGDGSRFGVSIEYLHEDEQLGTAGALGGLPARPESPVFVMNGDVLTKVDFVEMLNFHQAKKAAATMAVRTYDMEIPYGVVNVENDRILSIQEKPLHQFFVNAGIYVISEDVFDMVPFGQYIDMPTLFQKLMDTGQATSAFPAYEYWMDIGQPQDFNQAICDYEDFF